MPVFGRIEVEERADGMTLRVVRRERWPVVRIVATVAVLLLAMAPAAAYRTPALPVGAVFVWVLLMSSTLATATLRAAQKTSYPRLRRSAEWTVERAVADSPEARRQVVALSVDGQVRSKNDLLAAVLVTSLEPARVGRKFDKTVARFRPTLVLRDELVELDAFEDGDEKLAELLTNTLSAAISGSKEPTARVRWQPAGYQPPGVVGLLWALEMIVVVAACLSGFVAADAGSLGPYVAPSLFSLAYIIDLLAGRLAVPLRARRRELDAERLRSELSRPPSTARASV